MSRPVAGSDRTSGEMDTGNPVWVKPEIANARSDDVIMGQRYRRMGLRHTTETSHRADFYANPTVYDILHGPGTAADVTALVRIVRRFRPHAARKGSRWLEPACGTGRHLKVLARRAFRAIGFDVEPGMVDFARKSLAGLNAEVFTARMEDFARGRKGLRADVGFNLINTIRHLSSDAAMARHLRAMRTALQPSGVYVVGLSLSAYGLESPSEDVWTGSRGRTKVTQVVQYLPASGKGRGGRDERVISHMIVSSGARTRHVDSAYTLRSYSLEQWRRSVRDSGWTIEGVVDQDGRDIALGPLGYFVFVLGINGKRQSRTSR